MRLLITGGTGVLGRAPTSLAEAAGHELEMPGREELDLFDGPALRPRRRTRCRPAIRAARRPGHGNDRPIGDFGATLHVSDAGRALLCLDGERVLTERFSQAAEWHPQH